MTKRFYWRDMSVVDDKHNWPLHIFDRMLPAGAAVAKTKDAEIADRIVDALNIYDMHKRIAAQQGE